MKTPLIRSADGLAVLAHSNRLRCDLSQIERVSSQFMEQCLAGVEVIHSDSNDEMVQFLTSLADRFGLLKTGGSGFHGSNKLAIELGGQRSEHPKSYYDELLNHLQSVLEKDPLNPSAQPGQPRFNHEVLLARNAAVTQ